MVNPAISYSNLNVQGWALSAGIAVSATLDIRSAYGADVTINAYHNANVSAGHEVYAYKSADGGNTFEDYAEGRLCNVFDAVGNQEGADAPAVIHLDRGYWCLVARNGGPNTGSIQFTTAEIISAYA